jgi:ParB-like chromosome segregation protein Spo0J
VKVPIADLTTYPGNPRRGNIKAIAESLKANDQFAPLIVQRSTGHVLAGNHTLMAARSLDWGEIAVAYVDVDDDQARRIVLAANRTADLGSYDEDALLELLVSVEDLCGTGYTDADLAKLDGSDAVDGGDQSGDLESSWAIVVTCRDECQQLELISRFHEEGLKCKSLVA